MLVLISGVVLLTHKKPERTAASVSASLATRKSRRSSTSRGGRLAGKAARGDEEEGEEHALTPRGDGQGEHTVVWDVGDVSDEDEGEDEDGVPLQRLGLSGVAASSREGEGQTLMGREVPQHTEGDSRRTSLSSDEAPQGGDEKRLRDDADAFGPWAGRSGS
jgi:hypothetical protein